MILCKREFYAGLLLRRDMLLEIGKAHRPFVPPLCDHGRIVKIFLHVLTVGQPIAGTGGDGKIRQSGYGLPTLSGITG